MRSLDPYGKFSLWTTTFMREIETPDNDASVIPTEPKVTIRNNCTRTEERAWGRSYGDALVEA